MTKNKTLLLLLATAFLFSLASCVSESIFETPGTGYYDGERTVSLRLAPTATTRGESRPIGDNEPVFFRTGDLYLVTSAGIISRHFSIVACDGTPATETDIAANRINLSDLYPTGVTLPSMPGNVRYVVMVGNHSQSALPTSGMVGTAIENRFIHNHILSQYGALYPDPGVNLFGRTEIVRRTHDGTLTGTPLYSTAYPYNALFDANVLLEPTVARFEIHQMTAGGAIVDFTVAGIFIDRHYRRAHINGFIPETIGGQPNLMERGTTSAAFQENAACGYYPAGNNALFDEPGVRGMCPVNAPNFISGKTLTVRPNSTTLGVPNVWSYQVFARSHDHTRNITPPRIVVRLTGVKMYYDGELTVVDEDQYITVHGFTHSGTRLNNISAGNVYRILNLPFDETNLHYRPSRPINVEVRVQLAEWNSRPINPAGFRQPNPIGGVAPDFPGTWNFLLGEAVHGSCSDAIEYLWQWSHTGGRYNDDAWTPFIQFTGATDAAVVAAIKAARGETANALFINQTLTVNNLMQNTLFRRIAFAPDCGDYIVSAQAQVSLLTLATPIIITTTTGTGTPPAFCNTVTFRISNPSSWSDAQWDALAATNISVTAIDGTLTDWTRSALTRVGDYWEFTLTAATTPANATHTFAINFTGTVNGAKILPLSTDKTVRVNRAALPVNMPTVGGQNCFNVAFSTTPASNFSIPVTYTLTRNDVPPTAAISWSVSVVGGGTLSKDDIIHNIDAPDGSLTAVVTFNPALASNPDYASQIALESAMVTITATMTWVTGGCSMTVMASRVATIGNTPCCVWIGTGAQRACWSPYNLASNEEFVKEIYHRGAFFQWNSRTAWSNTDPRQRNDATTGWIWTTGGTDTAWANTQNTGAWSSAHCPCPDGWTTPTQAQLEGLLGTSAAWTTVNPVTGTTGHPGRIFGPGASASSFNPSTQIFLPVAGSRDSTSGSLSLIGSRGVYWSSTPNAPGSALSLQFTFLANNMASNSRSSAFSVRCVAEAAPSGAGPSISLSPDPFP